MNQENSFDRFEELDAGRAFGDLSSEEFNEWQQLAPQFLNSQEVSFDYLLTELELDKTSSTPLPFSLSQKLGETTDQFISGDNKGSDDQKVTPFVNWLGWGIAACLAVLLLLGPSEPKVATVAEKSEPKVVTVAEKLEVLKESSGSMLLEFTPASDPYAKVEGEVIWNDERQEGYMSLINLAANNPKENQYQLWIVDPERDELPVDGGVFDIPEGVDKALIPIKNALQVDKPTLFVITLEQPGGVVKSKQEVVVAIAKS